jgi:hypothetical protein
VARKVFIPDSAEIPAPVKTTIDFGFSI